MPSNNDVQEQQQRQQQQQLFAPSKLIEMTYLGDPGYCFLIANGFAFTLWYRMMLHALGRDSLWVPKGLAFKIGCTIAEEPSSYKQIYDKWFRHWLSRDVKHRTAFANAYCDGNHYKPVVVAAINRARQTMTKTFDRSKAREVLETELSRENVAPEDLFKDSPTNTKDLWEQGTVQRPEKIHANIMGDNKAIWNGLRRPYPGPPHYVTLRMLEKVPTRSSVPMSYPPFNSTRSPTSSPDTPCPSKGPLEIRKRKRGPEED